MLIKGIGMKKTFSLCAVIVHEKDWCCLLLLYRLQLVARNIHDLVNK